MSRAEPLTLSSIVSLVNSDGLYLLGYAWAFGMGKQIVQQLCFVRDDRLSVLQPSGSLSLQVR